ncbi:putative T7SS-secreted protein, partial [Lapillicoccus sp.]|uniref:putative T7SS-secreted protein n=1 Tax=Lapillicoccus sp. TaxID=1909287 RepID=UPI0025CB789D
MSDAYGDLMLAMPVERLVPGEPVGIDRLAQSMLRWSELFADAAKALRRIDVVWTGQAADAFQAQFQLQPAAFADAATAMDDAGYAVGSYGIAFHSAREAAAIALETFQRGVRARLAARTAAAAASAAAGGVGGFMPTSGPVDLRDEPAGLQDRLTGVEKLSAARQALLQAGERATTTVREAMAHAPEQVTALEHGANFMSGGWNQERTDFTVGAARGMLDLSGQATFPVVAPLVMNPVNQALDDLEWRWNIGSGSGFHQAGAIVIPAIATGG